MTIDNVLTRAAARWGDKTYLHDLESGRCYSFREVDDISGLMARNLRAKGIGPGTHVAILMENSADLLLLYLALARAGAVAAPVNPDAPARLLSYYLTLCDATVVIADEACQGTLSTVLSDLPLVKTVILRNEACLPGSISFSALFAEIDDDGAPFAVRFTDVACLALTSGTTGPSKAVVFNQATMLLIAHSYALAYDYRPDDVYYICLPLFHTSGLRGAAWVALLQGASVALARKFSVSRFWSDIRKSGATTFDLLGAMASFLWQAPSHPLERQHRVRMVRVAPVPPFGRQFEARFGVRLVSTYGLTDAAAPVARTLEDPADKFFSCGRPRPGFEVRIVDSDDVQTEPGVTGEIVIRADVPWLMPTGYYNNVDANASQWRNGWFHTGDLGWLDGDGYLYFAGRAKDVIRRRGENISAWEVEQFLRGLPGVKDAAVYPVASIHGEDEIAATIVPANPDALREQDIRERCREGLLAYMVPEHIELRPFLPLTPSQKIDKVALRREAEARVPVFRTGD
ncbi:AMP-binding protein [Agrobacterium sp. T29]|uniref:AMP-binding protein n=1 Tax=Agrobacterium sp. T29 TaxID=2580515 RepID=UPI00143D403E|nr:AMP-binding protein [Agrobacterium sp. T29]